MRASQEKKIPYEHFSSRLAKRLFKLYPAWKEFAGHTTEGSPEGYLYYLVVSVPSQNPSVADPLVISVDLSHEVTLSWFGGWHIHILTKKEEKDEHYFSRVLTEIDRIFSEEQVIAVCYHGDESIAGSSFAAESDIPAGLLPEHGQRLMIRSWRGTHDKEIAND